MELLSRNSLKYTFFVIAIVVLILLPQFLSGYWMRILTSIFMYAVIAQGMNLMYGYMGYLPFGNVMFFGIGAYMTAIFMEKGLTFLVTLPLAGAASVAVSVLLGFPVLRLRGHYFAIATLGMNGAILSIVQNTTEITGGAMGTTLPIIDKTPQAINSYFYFAMFSLMVIASLVIHMVTKSRFGYGIRSIKANEEAANSMGINTTYHKVVAWAVSAFITSIAGSVYAFWMSFIAPDEVFDVMIAVNTVVIMLIGGAGTIIGPVLGAFIIEFISEVSWSHFMEYHLAVLGVATIIIVYFVPKGITGSWAVRLKQIKQKTKKVIA